jgi:hypothetical protein
MSVVNVKVGHIRPEFDNLRDWMEDSNNIYIGRKGIVFVDKERFPKKDSKFCNPFKVGKDGTLEEVVVKFEKYMRKKIEDGEIKVSELLSLKGKRLGCWCKPNLCHGDILLKLIEEYDE